MTDDSFGRWLRRRRRALDLTQDDLAQQVGCSAIAIRKIEADERRPSKQIAAQLARILQLVPEDHAAFITFARTQPHLSTPPPPQLPAERVPPHASHPRPPTLLAPLTRLIGRDHDLAAARNTLLRTDTRLLTLIGAPGIGKTRLSVQVAAELREAFVDGVCFVALAPIRDPHLVAATIAQALGIKESGDQPLLTVLVDYLRDKRLLLVLDNCEHVLAAAPLISELLTTSRNVKMLATSRAPLHVRGEQLLPVPPLLLPNLARLPDPITLAGYAAVALFVERAREAQPNFVLTDAHAPSVAAICAHLDGLPLAIELAAARITLLPPLELLARLRSRLTLLTRGALDLPARQQTLRNAIDWSYALLTSAEQALFRRLAAFVGGCTLAAAEAICNAPSDLGIAVVDGLASLIDNNLVRHAESAHGEPRFMMLETIREYALERLAEHGEVETVGRRHAEYYLLLTEAAIPQLRGADQIQWLDRLEHAHDNLRVALGWTLERHAVDLGARLAAILAPFWIVRGYLSEGRAWLTQILARLGPTEQPNSRARVLIGAGILAHAQGDNGTARVFLEESLAISQAAEDAGAIADALFNLAWANEDDNACAVALFEASLRCYQQLSHRQGIADALNGWGDALKRQGEIARASALHAEALARYRELDDTGGIAYVLLELGDTAHMQGDATQARVFMEESLPLFQQVGDKSGIAEALSCFALLLLEQGEAPRALDLYEQSLTLYRELGIIWRIVQTLGHLAEAARWAGKTAHALACSDESLLLAQEMGSQERIAGACLKKGQLLLAQGDAAQAATLFRKGLGLFLASGMHTGVSLWLVGCAGVAVVQRQAPLAAQLLGAAAALRDTDGEHMEPLGQRDYDSVVTATRAQLDEATFAAAWAAGQAMPCEQASTAALSAI